MSYRRALFYFAQLSRRIVGEKVCRERRWHIYAIYEHEHVWTPNGWKISKIKMTPNFQEGNPKSRWCSREWALNGR
jgi:hypothetical protein